VIRMNKEQKRILIGTIVALVVVPFVPYWLEPRRWNAAIFFEEALEIFLVAAILIFVFRSKTEPISPIQPLSKKRRMLGGLLLASVAPVFGPGHGYTVLFQFTHFAYAAVTDNLAYFGLPYILAGLVVYYFASAFVLFLALSSIVWIKSSVIKDNRSLEM
jgi:hypothetical protein